MATLYGKRWGSAACIVAAVVLCQISVAEYSGLEVKADLPQLPDGVYDAADIELRAETFVRDANIPGLKMSESRWGVLYWNRSARDSVTTLDLDGARKLARTFLDRYFPGIRDKRQFIGHGLYTTEEGEGKSVITGYTISYVRRHRLLPVLNDKIRVTIKGDEVVGVDLAVYSVEEVGQRKKLLSAVQCLAKVAEQLKMEIGGDRRIAVGTVQFGYEGGFVQSWEERGRNWSKPFRAFPVYKFTAGPAEWPGASRFFVFDARTAELIYPKRAEGKTEVAISGPELEFTKDSSYEVFVIGPSDVKIEKAIFEMENVLVASDWVTYSVNKLFTQTGEWKFGNHSVFYWTVLQLDVNKDQESIARGAFEVDVPGRYEVEFIVSQRLARDKSSRTVRVSIDGRSQIMGLKGPVGHRIWERWGIVELTRGEHAVEVCQARGIHGYCEIGPMRIRPVDRPSALSSRVKDLKLRFERQNRAAYYNPLPPLGKFETGDVSGDLRSAFHSGPMESTTKRRICSLWISSASAGLLRVRCFKVRFVTGDQEKTEEKAKQFVLIYPNGESSRQLYLEEIRVFVSYVESIIFSPRGLRRSLLESLALCELAKRKAASCQEQGAGQVRSELQKLYIKLVQEEAKRLANSFYSTKGKPPPEPCLKILDRREFWWCKKGFDKIRITDNGEYLDPWGNPYAVEYLEKELLVHVHSYGPDGRDDGGGGDDIESEGYICLIR